MASTIQKTKNHVALKYLLWLVAVYHIGLGLLGIFAKDFTITLAKNFFNFNLDLTNQVYWILNPFSAYVLIFGVFIALAAKNPVKYKDIIYVGVGLCAIRVIQRMFFFFSAPKELIFDIDPVRNAIVMVIVAIIGTSLFFMARKLK